MDICVSIESTDVKLPTRTKYLRKEQLNELSAPETEKRENRKS